MMLEQARLPAAPESQAPLTKETEQAIRRALTPGQARLIAYAATRASDFLTPNRYSLLPAHAGQISQASAEALPFAAGEQVSKTRREAYWQEGARAGLSFAEQNREWNGKLAAWVRGLHQMPTQDPSSAPQLALARQTLAGLGLTGDEATVAKSFHPTATGTQTVTLNQEVEAFRERYLADKSDIRGFVHNIAGQCADAHGTVDLTQLHQRLSAIRPLLIVFGDKAVDSLVYDYTVSFGLLSQQAPMFKEVLVKETQVKLQEAIAGPEHRLLYEELSAYQTALDRAAAGLSGDAEPQGEQVFPQSPGSGAQSRDVPSARLPDVQPDGDARARPQPQAAEAATPQDANGTPAGPEPVQSGPDIPAQHEEVGRFVATVERRLREALGRDVSLTPEQKSALPIIPTGEWQGGWYGYKGKITPLTENEYVAIYRDQYQRLQRKGLSHEEIVQELNKLLRRGAIIIDEDGKNIAVGYADTRDGVGWIMTDTYDRQP